MLMKIIFRFLLLVSCVVTLLLFCIGPMKLSVVQAQNPGLTIITPYYGSKSIRSYFDHSYPNYYPNNYFVRYDGQHWTGNVDIGSCSSFINCYDGHNGLDIALEYEHVLAAADGFIWEAGWTSINNHSSSYGLRVLIKHNYNGKVYFSRYAHLTTLAVEPGQYVKAGQVIGTSGSTGASTGPHLHFDVAICINTICINPYIDFHSIDPYGWQPNENAPIQYDPWGTAQNPDGADSYCMWRDGEFVNLCNPTQASRPIPAPIYGDEFIIDDTIDNSGGFLKGYNGIDNAQCIRIDPDCREWWQTNGVGWGNHTYRTISNGLGGDFLVQDNWAKWKQSNLPSGLYEIFVYVPDNLGYPNNTFTWQAHYKVVGVNGIPANKLVDEYIGEGEAYNPRNKWLCIGTNYLDGNSSVYLLDDGENPNIHCPNGYLYNGNTWCRVATDAVRFVRIKYLNYIPAVVKDLTRTPTLTPIGPTSTPTRTPTPNPAYGICEPNETVDQWGTEPNNNCSLRTITDSYFLYPFGSAWTDADVFRFGYYISNPENPVSLTFYLNNIPPDYPYRFEVYDSSNNWLGVSTIYPDGTQFYTVVPSTMGMNYFYMRVYSEYEYLGPYGYSPIDTYEVHVEITYEAISESYPAP